MRIKNIGFSKILKKKYLLFLLAIVSIIYWRWWIPGPRVATDYPYVSSSYLREQFDIPRVWQEKSAEGLGEYTIFTLWSWPMSFLFGLFANLGLNFSTLERLLQIIPLILIGSFSIWKFLSKSNLSKNSKFVASIFYLANTYILLLVDGGQLMIGLAYVWFPYAYMKLKESLNGGLRDRLISGLAVSVLVFFDIRFIFALLLLSLATFIYELIFTRKVHVSRFINNWFKSGFVVSLVIIGLNFFWLSPLYLAPIPSQVYDSLTQNSNLSFTTYKHALTMLQPHWYKNVFGKVAQLNPTFFLIPALVFMAPVLKRKSRKVWFWVLVAGLSVFLTKGSNPPLPGVYLWLFDNIPGFSLFRDSTKFFFLVALSYSVLIGFSINELEKKIHWKLKFLSNKITVLPLLIALYFILIVYPVWSGKMTGTFSEPYNQKEFVDSLKKIEEDTEFNRIFWIPSMAPMGHISANHPALEASRLVQKRPFVVGTVGKYELFNFLREAPHMDDLFSIAGVRYIAYPYPDTRREELKQDNVDYYYAFLDQLTSLSWVEKRISEPSVAVLKTKDSKDRFFVAQNTFCIVGSDSIYDDLKKIANFDLSENALIFLEENPGLGKMVKETLCTYLLYGKGELDLKMAYVDEVKFIYPSEHLDLDPGVNGWWKRDTSDFLWWRHFLQEKYGLDYQEFDYGGGYAIAEGNREWSMVNDQWSSDNVLLARVMTSNRGGKIEFFQEDEKIGEINTKIEDPEKVEIKLTGYGEIEDQIFEYDKADFSWFEVGGLVSSDQELKVRTQGDINVVNSLISISEEEWNRINGSIDQYEVIRWDELSDKERVELFTKISNLSVSYERINPTNYKVKVENVKSPVTLVFSQTYDPLWQISKIGSNDTKYSYPLYSLINGFTIDESGEYDIYFSAQKYVLPGLFISGACLIIILFLLLFIRRQKSNI
jgi:hypothetical protein